MSLAMGAFVILMATGLILTYLVFFWWLDRYEREPLWLVLLIFLWGGVGGTLLGCILSLMMSVPVAELIPAGYVDFYTAVMVAPLAEEFTKGLIFLGLILTPYIDNETDGLIYGAATGLGFAAVENLIYFAVVAMESPESLLSVIIIRTLFTALVHSISSALLGYSIGYVRHRRRDLKFWMIPLVGFGLAVLMHGLWNFLAMLSESGLLGEGGPIALMTGFGLVGVMSVVMFGITQCSLYREHKVIERYLRDEAGQGVLPMEHAEVIPSWWKRRGSGWLPSGVPRSQYLKAATLLAFRRYQMDTSAPRFRDKYQQEVERYREVVRQSLRGA